MFYLELVSKELYRLVAIREFDFYEVKKNIIIQIKGKREILFTPLILL